MARRDFRNRFTVATSISQTPMPEHEWRKSESILAKLIARAYATEHPELFGPDLAQVLASRNTDSDG